MEEFDNIEVLDRDHLVRLKLRTEEEAAALKERLSSATARRYRDGTLAPSEWFAKTSKTLRAKNLLLSRIAARLGQLKRQERAQNRETMSVDIRSKHIRFLHSFYRAAKRNLSEGEFEAIIEIAHDYEDTGSAEAFECSQCNTPSSGH